MESNPEQGLDVRKFESESKFKLADLLVKGLLGAIITLGIGILGYLGQENQRTMNQMNEQIAATNRQMQAWIKFASEQKELDINLGMRMFETLMTHYLRKDEFFGSGEKAQKNVQKNLLLLRLITLNFQDVPINLKPLFEQFDYQLTDSRDKKRLREIALEVAGRQAFRLTFNNNFDSGEIEVKEGDPVILPNLPVFRINIDRITPGQVTASAILPGGRIIKPIHVSYFDMPIVDNLMISNDMRASLLLLDTDGGKAKVRLVAFQSDLAADRFDIKEMTRDLRNNVSPEKSSP